MNRPLYRDDAHAPAVVSCCFEFHGPRDEREERVVLTDADVAAGEDFGAALADDDRPRLDAGARVFLDAEPLPGAVSSVAGRTRAFLVCHFFLSLDLRDSEGRFFLPVAAALPRTRLVLVLEHADLGPSSMTDDLRRHDGVAHERRAGPDADAVGEQKHLVEDDRVAGVASTAIDGDGGSLFDPVASRTATDDGVHGSWTSPNRKSRRAACAT